MATTKRDGSWRWDTALRIRGEGRQAYLNGKPESACPYSRGFWGFGGAWDQGYLEAKSEAERGIYIGGTDNDL